jgi:Mg-chelatase subunit ChlD
MRHVYSGPRSAAVLVAAVALVVAVAALSMASPPPSADASLRVESGASLAQTGRLPSSGCRPIITESVRADAFRTCDGNAVTVTVGVTCLNYVPVHAVFLIAKHLLMQDHLEDVKRAAREAVGAIDFGQAARVGVVSLSVQVYEEVDLTDDKGAVVSAINKIQLDALNPFTEYHDWLGESAVVLEKARRDAKVPPIEVMVLYSTGCPTGYESYCQRQQASAAKARSDGITILGVCNPRARPFGLPVGLFLPANHCRDVRTMASPGYYYDLQQASRVGPAIDEIVARADDLGVKTLTIVENVPGPLTVLPGSARPAPDRATAGDVRWTFADLVAGGRITVTYGITTAAEGPLALRDGSAVDLVDTVGRAIGPALIPTRTLHAGPCVRQTPTPVPTATDPPSPTPSPSATATATTTTTATPTTASSATPTPTSVPGRAFLPVVLGRVCKPTDRPNHVVLVIDASSSMTDASAGRPKIDHAREAAGRFVDLLALGEQRDRAAIVAFNRAAEILVPLSADRAALHRAIDDIRTASGTRLDLAIALAQVAFDGGPPTLAEPSRTVVLLTDGRSDEGTSPAAIGRATDMRGRGYRIVAIGLGDDIDADVLRAMSGPGDFLSPPTADVLRGIYEALATRLPCPGGVIWGR